MRRAEKEHMHGPCKCTQKLGEGGSEEERPEKGSAVASTGGAAASAVSSPLWFPGEAQEVVALPTGKSATRLPPRSWPSAVVKAVAFSAEARGGSFLGVPGWERRHLHTDTGHSETGKRQGGAPEQIPKNRPCGARRAQESLFKSQGGAGPPATALGPVLGPWWPAPRGTQGQVRLPHNPAGAQLTHGVDKTQADTAGKPGGACVPPKPPVLKKPPLVSTFLSTWARQTRGGSRAEPSVTTPAAAFVEVRNNEAGRSRGPMSQRSHERPGKPRHCSSPQQPRAALQDNLGKERDNQAMPGPQQLSLPGSPGPMHPRHQCQSRPSPRAPRGWP